MTMRNIIVPQKYESLSDEDKTWYSPFYKKYKITKHRAYEDCDLGHTHFVGWRKESTPIGEPIGYNKIDAMTHNIVSLQSHVLAKVMDETTNSNTLMHRIINNSQGFAKIRWEK